jgi:hypothetical protein
MWLEKNFSNGSQEFSFKKPILRLHNTTEIIKKAMSAELFQSIFSPFAIITSYISTLLAIHAFQSFPQHTIQINPFLFILEFFGVSHHNASAA